MIIGNKTFDDKKTYVMAIINLTPDSFYDKSRCAPGDVMRCVEKAVEDGADIIDVGAQSTRPGYTEISAAEEIERFSEAVRDIKKNFDVPLSVDTYFSESARVALDLGADMINDVWGLTHDKDMARTIASYGASVCIMHNSLKPLEGDIWGPITEFLSSSVRLALESGIERDRICLDGGVGFAKNREQNLELVRGYARLKELGYPLLLGASRKSLFGGNVEDRLSQTLETTRAAARERIMFVRVHDVKENVEAIKTASGRP